MTHTHDHTTSAGPSGTDRTIRKRLALVLALVLVYMVAELVGGLLTGSLALLADAAHMLSDAASLGLALFALWFARRPSPPERTYGYYRAEILAALANGGTLVAISLWIFYEAWQRLRDPPAIEGAWMMAVAAGGLAVNLLGLWILRGARGESLNVRGAWLHVLADTLGSVQVLAAGALILAFDWRLADPIASILIGILVLYSARKLLMEAVAILMEGAPGHIDVDEVREAIRETEGVRAVHDLHIWTITSGFVALSCHVVASGRTQAEILDALGKRLEELFGIRHTTIQVEPPGFVGCDDPREPREGHSGS